MRPIPAPPTECLFCGSTTNRFTEEHVWPKWVSKELRKMLKGTKQFRTLRSSGQTTTLNKLTHFLEIKTDRVCDTCNGIWLSRFENEQVKPIATIMLRGTLAVPLTRAVQSILAAWAYKTSMLLEVANPDTVHFFFDKADFQAFRRITLPPETAAVYLGYYDCKGRLAHSQNPMHRLTEKFGNRRTLRFKITTLTAGHLALQVLTVRNEATGELVPAKDVAFELTGTAPEAIAQIWGGVDRYPFWPPRRRMNHQDVEDWTNMYAVAMNAAPMDSSKTQIAREGL
jgi:hypothetical protein